MSKYDPEQTAWMWRELENVGVKSLKTNDEVDSAMADKSGTTLLVINSVCGCAAGGARPGVGLALQNELIPNKSYTVFAGVDKDATAHSRTYFKEIPPSSPSVAMFKEGRLVFFLPRNEIEGYTHEQIAQKIIPAFDEHCENKGPSVPLDQLKAAFEKA